MRIVVLMDDATLKLLDNGRPPIAGWSHDKNLFQFAHESLRKGYDVYFCSVQSDKRAAQYLRVYSVYPFWDWRDESMVYEALNPDVVVGVFLEALNVRALYPQAKIVAIQAAIHWAESPETFSAHYLFDMITAIRYNVDFLITQNSRMKDLIDIFAKFIAKTSITDRILVAPLGIVEDELREHVNRTVTREQMGLGDDEIGIINSGGVWLWTDFNNFLEAYCRHCSERESRFKLFIMGFQQPDNNWHTDYISQTHEIISRYPRIAKRNIVAISDWYDASQRVKQYTAAADIGLNVNLPSLENWQSYRLRFLDYLYFGLPAINTSGDQIADELAPDALFVVRPGDIEGYTKILRQIEDNPAIIQSKSKAMRRLAKMYDSRMTYGVALDLITGTNRRQPADFAEWPETVLDFAARRERERLSQ